MGEMDHGPRPQGGLGRPLPLMVVLSPGRGVSQAQRWGLGSCPISAPQAWTHAGRKCDISRMFPVLSSFKAVFSLSLAASPRSLQLNRCRSSTAPTHHSQCPSYKQCPPPPSPFPLPHVLPFFGFSFRN